MKYILGSLLITSSLILGYFSYDSYQEANKSMDIGPIKIEASNKEDRNMALAMGAASIVMLISGIYIFTKK